MDGIYSPTNGRKPTLEDWGSFLDFGPDEEHHDLLNWQPELPSLGLPGNIGTDTDVWLSEFGEDSLTTEKILGDTETSKENSMLIGRDWLERSRALSASTPSFSVSVNSSKHEACLIPASLESTLTLPLAAHIHRFFGQLPNKIFPCDQGPDPTAFWASLPHGSQPSLIRVCFSRQALVPTGHNVANREPLERPDQGRRLLSKMSVRELSAMGKHVWQTDWVSRHLDGTLQLEQMGLTGDPVSRGGKVMSLRLLETELRQAQREVAQCSQDMESLRRMERSEAAQQDLQASAAVFQSHLQSLGITTRKRIGHPSGRTTMDFSERMKGRQLEMKCAQKRVRLLKAEVAAIKDSTLHPNLTHHGGSDAGSGREIFQRAHQRDAARTSSGLREENPLTNGLPKAPSKLGLEEIAMEIYKKKSIQKTLERVSCNRACRLSPENVSGNVRLFLDKDPLREISSLEELHPSLLVKRFERWIAQRDRPGQDEDSTRAMNLDSILEELATGDGDPNQCLAKNHEQLCLLRASGSATLGTVEHETATGTDTTFEKYLNFGDDPKTHAPDPFPESPTQEPIIVLPRILAWSSRNPEMAIGNDTEKEQDVDFVIEEFQLSDPSSEIHVSNGLLEADSNTACHLKEICGPLKAVWNRIGPLEQEHLMGQMVRMLSTFWTTFDILANDTLSKCPQTPHPTDEELWVHKQTRIDSEETPSQMDRAANNTESNSFRGWLQTLHDLETAFVDKTFKEVFTPTTEASTSMHLPMDPRATVDCSGDDQGRVLPRPHPLLLNDPDLSQRMTTTEANANDSLALQDKVMIHPLEFTPSGRMRWLDFSLDDVLIQATVRTDPLDCGHAHGHNANLPQIVGVSRWKVPLPGAEEVTLEGHLAQDYFPFSSNEFQQQARPSAYPLVHLFSIPDVFCPVACGGLEGLEAAEAIPGLNDHQDFQKTHAPGLAHILVRQLALVNPAAAKFMTEDRSGKERWLYHRWMKAWHEQSPWTPKEALVRFDFIRSARQAKAEAEEQAEEKKKRVQRVVNGQQPRLQPEQESRPECAECAREWIRRELLAQSQERCQDWFDLLKATEAGLKNQRREQVRSDQVKLRKQLRQEEMAKMLGLDVSTMQWMWTGEEDEEEGEEGGEGEGDKGEKEGDDIGGQGRGCRGRRTEDRSRDSQEQGSSPDLEQKDDDDDDDLDQVLQALVKEQLELAGLLIPEE